MTIEQKAKAYDEAIKVAENIRKYSSDPAEIKRMEEIFPELQESEDERIRGAIIDHLKDNNLTEWAAWLEKQGEKETDMRNEYLNELLIADDIYQMSVNDGMVAEAKERAINALSELEISELLGLEKQGEPFDANIIRRNDEMLAGY